MHLPGKQKTSAIEATSIVKKTGKDLPLSL